MEIDWVSLIVCVLAILASLARIVLHVFFPV